MTVYQMTEVVGTSQTSVSDAIRGAIERASLTYEGMQWFEVKEIRGRINEANAPEYQVKVEIGFQLRIDDEVVEKKASRAGKEPTSRQTRSTAAQLAAKRGEKGRSDLARNFKQQSSK